MAIWYANHLSHRYGICHNGRWYEVNHGWIDFMPESFDDFVRLHKYAL